VGTAALLWSGLESTSIVRQHEALKEAGLFVYTVSHVDGTLLDAARCDQLNTVVGVVSAGGVVGSQTVTVPQLPSNVIEVLLATPGLPQVVWPEARAESGSAAVLAGDRLTADLGLTPGSWLSASSPSNDRPVELYQVDWVAPESVRFPRYADSVIVVTPPQGGLRTCLIETQPQAYEAVGTVVLGWFPDAADIVVAPLLGDSGIGPSPETAFQHRLSRSGPLIGTALLTVLSVVTWLSRRPELALYRLLGLTDAGVVTMVLADVALTVWAPTWVGACLAQMILWPSLTWQTATTCSLDLARLAVALSLTPLASLLVCLAVQPFDAVKGR
jgi:hypothetical protein